MSTHPANISPLTAPTPHSTAVEDSVRTDVAATGPDLKRQHRVTGTDPRRRRGGRPLLAGWLAAGRSSSWLTSAAIHVAILVLLSALLIAQQGEGPALWLSGAVDDPSTDSMDFDLGSLDVGGAEQSMPRERSAVLGSVVGDSSSAASSAAPSASAPSMAATATDSFVDGWDSLSDPLASTGGGLEGRDLSNRRALALRGGGTVESEAAVEAGLAWLAAHQWPDGGWRFDLTMCPNCQGYCRDSGNYRTTTAATGLALLCFLGAGYSHEVGPYQDVVSDGLYYLEQKQLITSKGGDLRDMRASDAQRGLLGVLPSRATANNDTMYSHGVASLALTEAYAMTRDRELSAPAQEAINFIVNSQYQDGGWRYYPGFENPGMPGDTTISGWQIAALKSGLLGGLDVPYDIWMRIMGYLDSVEDDGGATYSYVRGEKTTNATTAIGLLSRMVCGWPREHRPLLQGAAKLGGQFPADNNIYSIYYASQVLHHVRGPAWEKWNPRMRRYLVETQSRNGHETGSWYFQESHSTPGGRLYTTALAIMTLEVYYRYMPLYQEGFVDRAP